MKKKLNPVTRVKDYEFLGIYRPNPEQEDWFWVYDILLENNIRNRIFYRSMYGVIVKGQVVEYEIKNNKLICRPPVKLKQVEVNDLQDAPPWD